MGSTDSEELGRLPTEARNPRSERLDEMSTIKMLTVMNDEDATVAGAVRAALPVIAEVVDAVAARLRGGEVVLCGGGDERAAGGAGRE